MFSFLFFLYISGGFGGGPSGPGIGGFSSPGGGASGPGGFSSPGGGASGPGGFSSPGDYSVQDNNIQEPKYLKQGLSKFSQ